MSFTIPGERVTVVGGGLAGCEVALGLARHGVPVRLIEMKPAERTPAAELGLLGELVCSNSLRSADVGNAVGLLKWEMERAGSAVMAAARKTAVPAGDALAVNRVAFSEVLTAQVEAEPLIERVVGRLDALPPDDELTVLCTGPLTASPLAEAIAALAGRESLYFYDAVAPIVDGESVDWSVVWRQSRYEKGDGADYANVPLDEAGYLAFVEAIAAGEKVVPRAFEEPRYFEGCLPLEVMVERGPLTLAHGPLKPVGLTDPRTGRRPYAVLQLRMENQEGTAWNLVGCQTRLKYPEQKRIFRMLPGLERAEFLRLGSVHRNTYLHAPSLLSPALHWHDRPNLYFAGQITGVEGYVESAACGQLVLFFLLARLFERPLPALPPTTAFGALLRHLRGDGMLSAYSPSNLNWSLFAPLERGRKVGKREHRQALSARAQADFEAFLTAFSEGLHAP